MGELRPAKGISLSFNKTAGRAGRTNSTILSKYQYSNPVNFIPLNILFHLCVSVKWSLNYSVLSSVQKSVFYTDFVQYNTVTLFKEGSAITYCSFLTYGPEKISK